MFSQENKEDFTLEANYFYGNIIKHNKDITHLITGHPEGFILSFNQKTFGKEYWQQKYNYPDWGFSTIFQNSKNETLGNNIGVYAHLNFYFIKRNLQFRVGQGIAFNNNPFDINNNIKNSAYGSRFLSATYLMLSYNKENVFKSLGIKAGFSLLHYSNGSIKAPNTSTNTIAFTIGTTYKFTKVEKVVFVKDTVSENYKEPLHYNVVLRGGVNESDYMNLGQQPFFTASAYVDKRVSYQSTLTAGVDVFFSKFLEKEIEYLSIAFPNFGVTGDEDYKRVGLFIGHDLNINDFALVTQIGYYIYYPYDFEGRIYQRLGLKYHFSKKIFGAATLKTHFAKAEAIEFGIGYRI
ncbi:MAG: acyloxyacyl hydrolase [Flavobacteriaceae bacterium]|nr:acyloxyacyl hydrolase [Flavobacteriaceae bacterium]